MKLDSRIKNDLGFICTCFDTEQSNNYIGCKGYFTDKYEDFTLLENCVYGCLKTIREEDEPYKCEENDCYFKFFLPEEFVFEKEKKLRPYTLDEFKELFKIGMPITLRRKDEKKIHSEEVLILGGYSKSDEQIYVLIGCLFLTLKELFEQYEWQPQYTKGYITFGVEE